MKQKRAVFKFNSKQKLKTKMYRKYKNYEMTKAKNLTSQEEKTGHGTN